MALKKRKKGLAKETFFRVDLELCIRDVNKELVKYDYDVYYPTARGTPDEKMARSVADSLRRIGAGGRLVEVNGTVRGKVIEEWFGVDRLMKAEKIESARIAEHEEKKVVRVPKREIRIHIRK